MTALIWCAAGLALLILGAELVVWGGVKLAARLGVPPLVIGITIVAVGTSAPELAVGIDAALMGNGALAVGNIAGTNIVNLLLILGLSAAIAPLTIRMQTIRLDMPVVVAASLLLLALAWDGDLSRTDGIILTAGALAYTAAILRVARRESRAVKAAFTEEFAAESDPTPALKTLLSLATLLAGIAIIVLGADWLVHGAVDLARLWGVSDAFIGLTVIAIGTSAPELATTIVSTIRGARDIAVGNLLGSSVYNILFILGVTCIVPTGGIAVEQALIHIDIPLMILVAIVCVPVFATGNRMTRAEGAAFVFTYLAYLAYLIVART